MANPVTNWAEDPSSNPATTFDTPAGQGTTAICDWDYGEDVITGRDYRIMHENMQCISDFDTEHGKKITQMVAGSSWTEDP